MRPQKSLGQNFLRDDSVIEAIVEGAGIGPRDLVIEVGPGEGALTLPAAKRARRLVAIELDRRLVPGLEKQLLLSGVAERSRILQEDILQVDLASLIAEEKATEPALDRVLFLGNLPYYITTPILMKVLKEGEAVTELIMMMQREVADRLMAEPGCKAYGALTVATHYYCTVAHVIDAPRTSFYPVPQVDSTVLRLTRREQKEATPRDEERFFDCIRTGFSRRRKTLHNCFAGYLGMEQEQIDEAFATAHIDPGRRGETLSVVEYVHLADAMARQIDSPPAKNG